MQCSPEAWPAVVTALLQAAGVQGQQCHKGGDLQQEVQKHGQRGADCGAEDANGGCGEGAAGRGGLQGAGGGAAPR